MTLLEAIEHLNAQKAAIEQTILVLKQLTGAPVPEECQRTSERMKQYWASRRTKEVA